MTQVSPRDPVVVLGLDACCCRGNSHKNVAATAAWGSRLLQGRTSVCLRMATMEAWPGGAGAATEP